MIEKVFKINDLLDGESDILKIIEIYGDLQRGVLKKGPLQVSNRFLTALAKDNYHTEGNYAWQLYKDNSFGTIMIEFFGNNLGFPIPTLPINPKDERLRLKLMVVTLHDSNQETINKIEKILSGYDEGKGIDMSNPYAHIVYKENGG